MWNTCVLFFQLSLLVGYGYAHYLSTSMSLSKQAALHSLLMVLPLTTLPFVFRNLNKAPTESSPIWWLTKLLLISVAPSVWVIAATAPLVTRWYGALDEEGSDDPYFLYSSSNLGSILALLSYPVLVEPMLGLQQHMQLWAYGYFLLLLVLVGLAFFVARSKKQVEEASPQARPGYRKVLWWIILAALPTSLMLAVTNHITSELPPVPLLWIIPLFIYLLSFVIAFSRQKLVSIKLVSLFQPLSISLLALIMFVPTRTYAFLFHLFALFVCCFCLITKLAKERPPKSQLTAYYLSLAVGGVIGGAFNAIVGPSLFPIFAEYTIVLVLICLTRDKLASLDEERESKQDLYYPLILAIFTFTVLCVLPRLGNETDVIARLLLLLVVAAIALYFRHRPVRFALAIAVTAVGGFYAFQWGNVYWGRSYYGVYRVVDEAHSTRRVLYSGSTIQGKQDVQIRKKNLYCYHDKGPIGTLLTLPQSEELKRVGAIGLGVGALANYGRPNQKIVFYEICPLVKEIANNDELFTYLRDSSAKVDIVIGDGRLSIAKERNSVFDLLVLDAFSANAIPVHLLTKEAVSMYFDKLKEDGICMVHISNRHLDIAPLLAQLARDLGLVGYLAKDKERSELIEQNGGAFSSWVLLARQESVLKPWLVNSVRWQSLNEFAATKAWTDDYVSYISLLRW